MHIVSDRVDILDSLNEVNRDEGLEVDKDVEVGGFDGREGVNDGVEKRGDVVKGEDDDGVVVVDLAAKRKERRRNVGAVEKTQSEKFERLRRISIVLFC